MKKLKLNLQQFEGAEVLTRSQLKQIVGGEAGTGGGGNCQAQVVGGEGGLIVIEDQTASGAQNAPNMVHWCCDSCCSASWAYHDNC
jgi:hypothetical protein